MRARRPRVERSLTVIESAMTVVERILTTVERVNRLIAIVVGVVLAAMAAWILVDVVLRQVGEGLGASEELASYVMAFTASWGLCYALTERAHVRIDLIRLRSGAIGRASLDLVSMATLAAVICVVAWQSWPVLAKSLGQGSRANTPLETPLWIPQSIWFAGWIWFAVITVTLLGCGVALLVRGARERFDATLGTATDVDENIRRETGS